MVVKTGDVAGKSPRSKKGNGKKGRGSKSNVIGLSKGGKLVAAKDQSGKTVVATSIPVYTVTSPR